MGFHPERVLNAISLFSGYGGIELGLGLVEPSLRTVCFVERDAYAIANLAKKISSNVLAPAAVYTDVCTFDGRPWRGKIHLLTGGIECFAAGSLVLAERGYIPIEDIRIGDIVLTHRGRWKRVTATMSRDNVELYRTKAFGCHNLIGTSEHPFYTRRKKFVWKSRKYPHVREFDDIVWTKQCDIEKNDFVGQILPPIEPDEHSEDFWWVVGRCIADGCAVDRKDRKSGGRVYICCAHKETDYLRERISKAGFNACECPGRTAHRFVIQRNYFYEFILKFGKYAYGKRIPREALCLEPIKAKAFIEGYLSGDGHKEIAKKGGSEYWGATTVSKSLAYGIALMVQRAFGVVASVRMQKTKPTTQIEGRTVNQRDYWRILIFKRNREAFVEGNYGWKPFRRSESCGVGTVYNISVEEDESYCVDGCIVHNCQPWSVAGKQKGIEDERWLWPEAYRIIREVEPTWVFLEEVGAFIRGGLGFVYHNLTSSGYCVTHDHFRASDVGAPHRRERLFILARRLDVPLPELDDAGSFESGRLSSVGRQKVASIGGTGEGNELGDTGCAEREVWQGASVGSEGQSCDESSSSGGVGELGDSSNTGSPCTGCGTQYKGTEFFVGDTDGKEAEGLGDAPSIRCSQLCERGGGSCPRESEGGMCEPSGAGGERCPVCGYVDCEWFGEEQHGKRLRQLDDSLNGRSQNRRPQDDEEMGRCCKQGDKTGLNIAEASESDSIRGTAERTIFMADPAGGMSGQPAEQERRQDIGGGSPEGLSDDGGAELADHNGAGSQGCRHIGECSNQLPSCEGGEGHELYRSIWPARPRQPQHDWEPARIVLADSYVARLLEPRTEQQADGAGQFSQKRIGDDSEESDPEGEPYDGELDGEPDAERKIDYGDPLARCVALLRVLYTAAFYWPSQVITGLPIIPTLVRDAYECTSRLDELRLSGNGVVCTVVSLGWIVLKNRLINFIRSDKCAEQEIGSIEDGHL